MPKARDDVGLVKRCECARSKWSDCRHSWHMSFLYQGQRYRLSLDKEADKRGEERPTTKTEAKIWRDRLRLEIRRGQYSETASAGLTLGDVCDRYLKAHVQQDDRREAGRQLMEWYIAALRRATVPAAKGSTIMLEDKPIDTITTADVEHIRSTWRRRTAAEKGGRVGVDRALKRLRHLFNWAIEHGYVDHSPFKRHGVSVIHFKKDQPRTRRLEPGEEERLLKHAPPLVRALIVAALQTGCRPGELLALRWRDVKWDRGVLLLQAENTKTAEARDVPITQQLRAILEMRQHGPDGKLLPPSAHVFGNEVGEPVKDIREAWTATCKAAKITGLQFRDLRREFASRLLETPGVSGHHVRDWLGHADLATTSRYLSTTRVGLQHVRHAFEQHRAGLPQNRHNDTDPGPEKAPVSESEVRAKSFDS